MTSWPYFSFILLILSGCIPRAVIPEPVEVSIPVAVACHAAATGEPDWNSARLAADATATATLKAALADLELSRAYIEELKAELAACG